MRVGMRSDDPPLTLGDLMTMTLPLRRAKAELDSMAVHVLQSGSVSCPLYVRMIFTGLEVRAHGCLACQIAPLVDE